MLVAGWLAPVLVTLSLCLLGRAFYVIRVLDRGSRWSRVFTWLSAFVVVGFWGWRLM